MTGPIGIAVTSSTIFAKSTSGSAHYSFFCGTNAEIREPSLIRYLLQELPSKIFFISFSTSPILNSFRLIYGLQSISNMAAHQMSVSFGEPPPKFHGLQNMADAIGIRVASLLTRRTSFRGLEVIDKARSLNSRVDQQDFVAEVRRWLSVELSDTEISNKYGWPDPSLAMYSIMQYLSTIPSELQWFVVLREKEEQVSEN